MHRLVAIIMALVVPLDALRIPSPAPKMQRRAAVAAGLALIPTAAMADSIVRHP